MPLFKYKAIRAGASYEGKREAPDKSALFHTLRSEGEEVISVALVSEENLRSRLLHMRLFGGVKMSEKIMFARNLGSMIEAGLSLTRALSVFEKQTAKASLKKMFSDINDSVKKGETLSDALKHFPDVFPPLFVSMVRAGEESGKLSDSLKILAMQMNQTYLLEKKIRGAMIYPGIIITVVIIIAILMMIYVVPTLSDTFEGLNVPLPFYTRAIIAVSNFLKDHVYLFLASVLALIAGIWSLLRVKKVKHLIEYLLLKAPVVGQIVRESNAARTARTLSSLLSSGVSIVTAIEVTADVVQNSYFKEVLHEASVVVEKGDALSKLFAAHEDLYPVFVSEMISVGEETGKLGEMLLGIAVFYEEEVDQKTKDLSTIVEPVLMVIIGAVVGLFAVSMISPLYSLVDYI